MCRVAPFVGRRRRRCGCLHIPRGDVHSVCCVIRCVSGNSDDNARIYQIIWDFFLFSIKWHFVFGTLAQLFRRTRLIRIVVCKWNIICIRCTEFTRSKRKINMKHFLFATVILRNITAQILLIATFTHTKITIHRPKKRSQLLRNISPRYALRGNKPKYRGAAWGQHSTAVILQCLHWLCHFVSNYFLW